MRPQILCISFSDIRADARVLRQLDVAAQYGDVTTIGYRGRPDAAAHHLELNPALPSLPQTLLGVGLLAAGAHRRAEFTAPAVRAALALYTAHTAGTAGTAGTAHDAHGSRRYDVVIANEARALPLAHRLARHPAGTAPVWVDLHEWAPEERAHVLSWRLLVKPFMTSICARYLPVTDAVTVVNDSIAALYTERFGCRTETVRNSRPFEDLAPSAMEPGVIRLVHSGAAVPGRNIEGMIEAVAALGPGYTLDFYLVAARDGGKYWRELRALAAGSEQITFHEAVPPADLPRVLNQYDVGIFSLPPRTRNHALMLPNKFFDFVQARLGIVFSPSPETSKLIEEYGLGRVTAGYSSAELADTLRGLDREAVASYKAAAHAAARALGSDRDEAVQRGVLERLLGA
jgi:hypothetical protein